ncbi:M20/M25/M40 family metallo-hydrolase [Clostridiaceae bacterium 35-E11]
MQALQNSVSQRMYEDLKKLVGCGNRFAGSEAEWKAAEFVRETFKKSTFSVVEEKFPIQAFEEMKSSVEVGGKEFSSRTMFYSIGTPAEGIEGELVFAGIGREEDYIDIDVKDKIVIIHRDKETEKDQFWPEVCTAAKRGAKGFILINFDPWVFITTLETGFFKKEERFLPIEPNPIPALIVNRDDGAEILRMMDKEGQKACIKAEVFNGERESVNVRAIKEGTEMPEEKILVYGHRDSAGTPGANDNGSGTVIMLEIARLLKDLPMKRTVELVSLGAEEQLGSAGSDAYIMEHRETLSNIKAGIELDMVAAGSPVWVMEGGNWPDCKIQFAKGICDYVVDTAEKMGYYMEKGFCALGTPDSGRFTHSGVSTTWIWGPGDIHYHSPEDTLDKVDPNKLKVVADVIATAVYNLANKECLEDMK